MGTYLSTPNREKVSEDYNGEVLSYGASCMQGWRSSQEDAHNCDVDFEKSTNSSFFAVYDGHGGAEVAQYTASHLPSFLLNMHLYKQASFNQALTQAFLTFDASLLQEPALHELKQLASVDRYEAGAAGDAADPEELNEAFMLKEEAQIPIEKLVEKYGMRGSKGEGGNDVSVKVLQSPAIRGKKGVEGKDSGAGALKIEGDVSTSRTVNEIIGGKIDSSSGSGGKMDEQLVNGLNGHEDSESCGGKEKGEEVAIKSDGDSKSGMKDLHSIDTDESEKNDVITEKKGLHEIKEIVKDDNLVTDAGKDVKSETDVNDNKEVTLVSKTTTTATSPLAESSSKNSEPQCSGSKSEDDDEDEDEDEDDSEDDNDDEEEKWKKASAVIDEDDEDDEEEDDIEVDYSSYMYKMMGKSKFINTDEEDVEDDEDDDDDEDVSPSGFMGVGDKPAMDSGCTAVVALLRDEDLFVANAGDSRCVVCRDCKAHDMSIDHKPEDDEEKTRIERAGGKITFDGRVNGGLNLSRAIGDHVYKQNSKLPLHEQMITALPDVKYLKLQEDDQFMVLACDGIWNVLTSQEVVEFVAERLVDERKLSSICEELFEFCLAPDTSGDGTGCDNMTCIIVKFNKHMGGGRGLEVGKVGGKVNSGMVEGDNKKKVEVKCADKNEDGMVVDAKKEEEVDVNISSEEQKESAKERVVKNGGVKMRKRVEEGSCVDGVDGSDVDLPVAKKLKHHPENDEQIAL